MSKEVEQLNERIKELKEIIATLESALLEHNEFLEQAPFDFKNGITCPNGIIDEGDVLGTKFLCELIEKHRGLIKEINGKNQKITDND